MTDQQLLSSRFIDGSVRVQQTTSVVASPSGASETVVATLPAFDNQLTFNLGVLLILELAYTLGSTPTSCQVRIRTGVTAGAGTVLYDSGAQTGGHATAGLLVADSGGWFHTSPSAGQRYCATLTVAGAGSASTVSTVSLTAIAF